MKERRLVFILPLSLSHRLVVWDQDVTLKMEAVWRSREKKAGSRMTLWSGHTSPGLLISGLLLGERIYQPGWALCTRRLMQFQMYRPGLQSRLAMILQAWFPALAGSDNTSIFSSSSFSPFSCFSHEFSENPDT